MIYHAFSIVFAPIEKNEAFIKEEEYNDEKKTKDKVHL